jgi:beta-lactamase class A
VGLAYRDLATGAKLDLNADSSLHAASTMKVPVMIQYFRDVDSGRLRADARVRLENRFASIVDGSPYSLDPGDDSDSAMYALAGTDVAMRELVERMITRSSNLATNVMIALVEPARVNATARALGASRIKVLRGVEDQKAYEKGLSNTTTAGDLAALFQAIAAGRAASPDATAQMLAILEKQEFNDEIPAGLPVGTRVAHKTGWITGIVHDAGIVFPPDEKPYVLAILTSGIADTTVAKTLIADLSREIWTFRQRHRAR